MELILGQELKGLRAMLSSPTYGPVDPFCQKTLRAAMMSASNHGLWWAGDISPDKQGFGTARNMSAQSLADHPDDADGILWVDSDIVLGNDSILKLLGSVRRTGYDFMCGVYHKKGEPFDPVIYWYDPDLDAYLSVENYNPGFITPIGACGFGLVWTGVRVIQAVAANAAHFDNEGKWFPDTRYLPKGSKAPDGRPPFGEDFNFCDKARMAGCQLYVDTGVLVGHKGDGTIFDRNHYLKWLAENGGHYKPPDLEAWRG